MRDPLDRPEDYDEAMAHALSLGLMDWAGHATARCQCPTCGAVFSTEGNFERHLAPGRNDEDYDGPWCRSPSSIGLVATILPSGTEEWHEAGPESSVWASRAAVSGRRGS